MIPPGSFHLGYRLRQVVVGLLLITLFTDTSLASPDSSRTLCVSLVEMGQNVWSSFESVNVASSISSWASSALLFFSTRGQRNMQVSRIEIVPGGDLAIRQGEPVNFIAIGYTVDGNPVNGLHFRWSVTDTARETSPHSMHDGIFAANRPGQFLITATARGIQAQANITVEVNEPYRVMSRLRSEAARGRYDYRNRLIQSGQYRSDTLSSKRDYTDQVQTEQLTSKRLTRRRQHGPSTEDTEEESDASVTHSISRALMRPADEDGWNNNNWWMADDPGNQTGNPPGSSPDAGAGNGNFQMSAPVVSLPGRGIDLSLSLNYNSRLWSKSGTTMSFDSERGYPAPGWNLGFGKMMFMGSSGGCMLIDADGTNHGYTGTISNYNGGSYNYSQFSGHTADSTFIDYGCFVGTYNGVTTMTGSVTLPNGTQVYYGVTSANGKQAFPSQITDSQGNYVSVSYKNNHGPELQTVTDTMGRVITFNYDSLNRLISVDVPKMDNAGTRTAVRLHYKSLTLNPGWAYGITTDTNNATPYVVDGIYYPGTSTGYWFNDSDSYSSYGMIAKVIEQRGMSWSGNLGDQGTITAGTMSKQAVYNYTLTPNYTLSDAPTYTTLTESWAGMDTGAAVTSYLVNNNDTYYFPASGDPAYHNGGSSPARSIAVTQPNGVVNKQYSYRTPGQWMDGLIFRDETRDPTTNALLAMGDAGWEQGSYDSPRPFHTYTVDEKGQALRTDYTYGSNYNQVTSQKEYGYDNATLLKETRNTYENSSSYTSRHIFSLVKSTEVYDGSGNRVAKTDYEYDGNAVVNGTGSPNLKNTPDVTHHLSTADPFTTDTQQVPEYCNMWDPSLSEPQCEYEDEEVWVPIAGGYYANCSCTDWTYTDVSVYDPNTIFRGNLTKTTVYSDAATPSGAITQTKQYDETGNRVAESASCCELKTYDYTIDTQYAYPTTQTRGSSDPNATIRNTSSAVFDFNTGLVEQSTDPNGRTSTAAYDADTLRPTTTTAPTGAYTTTTYDESGMTITDEVKDASNVTAGKTVKYLNGLGLVKREDNIGPSNVTDITETKFNQLGELWKQSRPYRSGDTVQWSEKFYDLQGRVTKIVEPDGSETKAFYNETPRPDSASNATGSTIRVMDAWGRERWGRYDALGRLAEVVEPKPDGDGLVFTAGSLVTNFSYNTLGRLTGTNQGGQLRSFKYDSLGRLTRQKLAEQTATINDTGAYVGAGGAGALWSSAFVYDDRSNVTQRTDARGVKTHYSYQISGGGDDPLNRIQSISYDLSGTHDTSKPIPAAPTVTYEYVTTGDQDRLKKVTAAGVSTDEFAYDTEGRVTDETKTFLNRSSYPLVTSYTYDTLNRTASIRLPAQYGLSGSPRKFVYYDYDSSSRLTTLKYGTALSQVQQAGDLVYNASDQTTSINIGSAGKHQVNEQYTFDQQTGLLINQKAVRDGDTLLDLSYDYNRNNSTGTLNGKTGHLTKILNNLDHNKDREYKFDAIGRLTSAKGGVNSALWSQTYSYDRYGNRTSVAATGVAADNTTMPTDGIPTLTYNTTANNNQITTSNANGQFEYDVAGNQTRALDQDGTNWIRYEYDAANRPVNIKHGNGANDGTLIETQQFGVGNERIALTDAVINQTTWYGDAVEYIETGGSGTLVWSKTCTYLGDSLLSTITPDGAGGETTEYAHPDRLGTKLVTNQSAGTNSEQSHLPFGTALDAESTLTTNPKRFTSYERSAGTGLDYAVNRTYDSKQGRFTQVDPAGMNAASLAAPQTLNLYAYCANDPINHLDPSGLGFWSFLKKLFKWIVAVIAVIVAVITIIAAPATIAGILAAISATASAGSSVMGALGYSTAAKILGWIALGTGIGAGIATIAAGPKIDDSLILHIASTEENTSTISWWQIALAGVSAAGSIANSFASGPKKKKQTAEQRQASIIQRTIASALWRLKNMPGCKEFIQGSSSQDPVAVLEGLRDDKNVFFDKSMGLDASAPVGQTTDLEGNPKAGQGVNSRIHLGRKFFDDWTVGGWKGTMNLPNTRTNIVLHELKHAVDVGHAPGEANNYYYNEIAKKCFGVTP